MLLALLAFNIVGYFMHRGPQRAVLPYTVFRQQVESGNVAAISTVGMHVDGTVKHPILWPPGAKTKEQQPYTAFGTVLPPFPIPRFGRCFSHTISLQFGRSSTFYERPIAILAKTTRVTSDGRPRAPTMS